jgi:hypothetical protein
MTTAMNYSYDLNDKFFHIGGPASLVNDSITTCKICAANGFPCEPIIFRKVVVDKWQRFDLPIPWQQYKHKLQGGKQY